MGMVRHGRRVLSRFWKWRLTAMGAVLLLVIGGARREASGAIDAPTRFGRIGLAEGLSSNWVLALARDRPGFLWVGTQDGLFRYDGRKCVDYRHDPADPHSLPSPVAGVLHEDARGRLWVGSRWASQGMALYDRALDRFQRVPIAGPSSGEGSPGPLAGLSDARVNAIIDAPGGRLWVATARGVDLVDYDQQIYLHHGLDSASKNNPPRLATTLLADRRGTLWVGTTEGLYILEPHGQRCLPWRGSPEAPIADLDGQRIEALREDESGHLWIATITAGLFVIDPDRRTIRRYQPEAADSSSLSQSRVRSLALDQAGTLWVGTENGGLDALDRKSGRFRHFRPDPFVVGSLGSSSVYALLADRQGLLWIGTYDNGLNYLSPSEHRFGLVTTSPAGLRDPRVTSFLEDREGTIWIGTDGGGLCRSPAGTDDIDCLGGPGNELASLAKDSVLAILQSEDGSLWMGGWGTGLTRLDPSRKGVIRYRHRPDDPTSLVSNDIWKIRRLRSGEMAVATQRGTNLFDPASGRAIRLSQRYPGVPDAMTLEITETRSGDLWLGQNARLVNIRPETGQVTVYGHDQSGSLRLAGGQVFAILEDSRGTIWIGGEGGLAYLPESHQPGAPLLSKSGLPNPVVTSLAEDAHGNLWATSHAGLSKLVGVVQDPSSRVLTHFDVHDGLQDNEFSRGAALRARDGRLYFGGRRGFNTFFPDRVPNNATPPPIVLTDLRVLGRKVRPGRPSSILRQSITETTSLSIPQDVFALSFEFAALNLVQPSKNRYAFMLEGFDTTWNDAGNRAEATYTQLRHGDYVLRIRAANNDGVWNEAGLALRLHVEPRWHERTWIRAVLVMLGLLMVVGFLCRRARRFRARERELTLRVDERTRALNDLNEQLEQRVRQRTAELEEEKQRLSVTMGSIADAVIAADVDGRIVLMNRVAEQLCGTGREVALGRSLAEVVPRLDPNTRQPTVVSTLALPPGDTPPSPGESLLVRSDGKELLIAESAAPIRDHKGSTLGIVLAFRDITRQRRFELQLATNEKVEALGVLAGGIAHDFNNLLTGLFGYLELSQRFPPGSSKQQETLGKAISLVEKGRGLTSKLLTFSKGETPRLAPVDLREVLSRSAEFALSGSRVVCVPLLSEDLWRCLGDRQQLDQVFDNLLLNARHAMGDNGEVSISAENVSADASSIPALSAGRHVRVSVADKGPGIAKELQGRIFEPFFTTRTKGTGLGLATTHSIVRRHKGHIEVNSEPGKGATFTVYLPAVDE